MNVARYLFALLLLIPGFSRLSAQSVPIGQWRDELPYSLCNSLTDGGSRIYISTPYAVFYYDKDDHSFTRITKITGLSDINISTIAFNRQYNTLVIAYTNANIDLIKDNTIINISDIERKQILGNKTINDIFFIGKDAYLSCGFGIVVLDISKEEIRDTYYIGRNGSQVNVLSLTKDSNDSLFAASDKGIYKAYANDPNLANFASWHRDLSIDTSANYPSIVQFDGKIFASKRVSGGPDTICYYEGGHWNRWMRGAYNDVMHLRSSERNLMVIYNYLATYTNPGDYTTWNNVPTQGFPLDGVCDRDGWFWIGDTYSGLCSYDPAGPVFTPYNLGGPTTAMAFSMTCNANDLYISPGGHDASFTPGPTASQIYHFDNTSWKNIVGYYNPLLSGTSNILQVVADPTDPKRLYAASFGSGIFEVYNDSVIKKYDESNSTLRHHTSSNAHDIRVGGVTYDTQGQLWASCSHSDSCLSMKKGDTWYGFSIPIANGIDIGTIVANRYGQVWVQMRYGNDNPNSLFVFDYNNTPSNPSDDQARLLNSSVGSGNIPGNTVLAMAEDKKGQIWVGTEKGVAVFYSPENVFSGYNFDAQQILVTQGNNTQYLLENETVTAIAVDGANRKWIGTDRGGVFLFSEDGTKQIYHFTADNSPLLSDRITCLAINQDGEVFFGTDKGVISFRSTATTGGETNENVYAFPNPVKENYEGYIAVKGLVENAQVRITDVNGNLVFSTKAEGGQVVWDGKDFHGRKANTGVYLVYAANDTGSEKVVTKILIIH